VGIDVLVGRKVGETVMFVARSVAAGEPLEEELNLPVAAKATTAPIAPRTSITVAHSSGDALAACARD
jgi:hypothetical protein